MLRAKIAAIPVATLLAAGLIGVPVGAASAAAGDCEVGVTLPASVRITSDDMNVGADVRDPGCMDWGSWDIVRSDGANASSFTASLGGTQHWDLWSNKYGQVGGPGTYRAVLSGGYDLNFDSISSPDSNALRAKYERQLTWGHSVRSGGYVTLKEYAKRYSYSGGTFGLGGYIHWSGAVVHFQERTYGQWHTVKTVTANSKGVASTTVHASRHYWRALVVGTNSVWGGRSGIHWG